MEPRDLHSALQQVLNSPPLEFAAAVTQILGGDDNPVVGKVSPRGHPRDFASIHQLQASGQQPSPRGVRLPHGDFDSRSQQHSPRHSPDRPKHGVVLDGSDPLRGQASPYAADALRLLRQVAEARHEVAERQASPPRWKKQVQTPEPFNLEAGLRDAFRKREDPDGRNAERSWVKQREGDRAERLAESWEAFAVGAQQAASSGQAMPAPPSTLSGVPRHMARVTEAALCTLAALLVAELESREKLAKAVSIAPDPALDLDAHISAELFQERDRNLQLRKHDVAMSERLGTVRAECILLRARSAECASELVASSAEIAEARSVQKDIGDRVEKREGEAAKLLKECRQLQRRSEAQAAVAVARRREVYAAEAACSQLERRLAESVAERERVTAAVQLVIRRR